MANMTLVGLQLER